MSDINTPASGGGVLLGLLVVLAALTIASGGHNESQAAISRCSSKPNAPECVLKRAEGGDKKADAAYKAFVDKSNRTRDLIEELKRESLPGKNAAIGSDGSFVNIRETPIPEYPGGGLRMLKDIVTGNYDADYQISR